MHAAAHALHERGRGPRLARGPWPLAPDAPRRRARARAGPRPGITSTLRWGLSTGLRGAYLYTCAPVKVRLHFKLS